MPALTREQFLSPADLETQHFPMPEFGDDAYVVIRQLDGRQLKDLLEIQKGGDDLGFLAELLIRSIYDDDGNRLFDTEGDIDKVLGKHFVLLQRLAEAVLDLNGMNDDADDAENKKKD